ncbi:MAG: Glu/Leu/Phe/Val dehydrogenase dimerization domain-containing protein [Acidimicrobiales bacterium]
MRGTGLASGGSVAGTDLDPLAAVLERLTRRYTYDVASLLGPERDVPTSDVSTDGRVRAWIMDTMSMLRGQVLPGVVTGKPLAIGGSHGRAGATSTR